MKIEKSTMEIQDINSSSKVYSEIHEWNCLMPAVNPSLLKYTPSQQIQVP